MTVEKMVAVGAYLKKVAHHIKTADGPVGFGWIGDAPTMGGPYSSHKLEADYQMKYPLTATLHPITYGAAALGALGGYKLKGMPGAAVGLSVGTLAGAAAESYQRYGHLMAAREKLLRGESPIDSNLSLDQFKTKSSSELEFISVLPSVGGHFADHRLEHDYTMKHPFVSTFHPGPYAGGLAGAAVGALLGKAHLGAHPAVTGMLAGGAVGLAAEGAHRAAYLLNAKRQILNKQNPIDSRFTLHQF